ncbi:MAG: M20/M25/M40 family metallo-hydrolase [Myxococcota bacterium]
MHAKLPLPPMSTGLLAGLALAVAGPARATPPHHDVDVVLVPDSGSLTVVDAITHVPPGATFTLHAGLAPRVTTKGWKLERVDGEAPAGTDAADGQRQTARNTEGPVPLEAYRLVNTKKKPRFPVEIAYGGAIEHPLETQGAEYQRSFSETPGTIQADGVYLARSSFWLPDFGESITYTLDAHVPDGWSAVSSGDPFQGEGIEGIGWNSRHPMDDVYLVAAKWTHTSAEVEIPSGKRGIDIYLREPDPGLAFRYEAATARYLTLYESMLTPYPFQRFALVENFWETGYGMPGFTLLGPEVIRFPWVLTSSYPHEILHTWWGNSATIDPAGGNWSEGLTAYMADHLFAEHRGQDAEYRRSTLKKFTDLAQDGDFPLVEFLGRTSAATEAVGYGKSLMFWHMIRRHIGEEAFLKGLAAFHVAYAFEPAGFSDLEPFLSEASGEDLKPFFTAWTTSTGAIRLAVEGVEVAKKGDGYVVTGLLRQTGDVKPGWVPVRLSTATGKRALEVAVALEGAETPFTIEVPADRGQPMRLDVDPDFDVMRILDPMEVPPALTSVYGDAEPTFVLPSRASEATRAQWTELAEGWARPGKPKLVLDSEVDAPPPGSWVLGWENTHGPALAARVAHTGAVVDAKGLAWAGETFDRTHSVVLVARADGDPERALAWVTAGNDTAIAGLARKLPHYTKYGLLAFADTAPDNVAKAVWPALRSPLTFNLTDAPLSDAQRPPQRAALAEMPPRFDAASLLAEARWVADPAREGRAPGSKGLADTTTWLVDHLKAIGIEPELQTWTESVAELGDVELTNVVVTLPGNGRPLPPVVVMSHLDHLGKGDIEPRKGNEGKVHPGADDNASGVAVTLGLLRFLASEPPRPRPVTFVFTTAEEAGLLGARHWLENNAGKDPFACVSIDAVGRLASAGQITIAGAETAREMRFLFMGVGYTTGATFGFAQAGTNASDHAACHEAGSPGVHITTGPHADYHSPGDTSDKLDGPGLATVAEASLEAVAYLAERTDPLTVQLGDPSPAAGEGGARKASLGTMPDFTFAGPGIRIADVMPASAAQNAGLVPGDVILAIDGEALADLQAFSNLLKSRKPGDEVQVRYRRGTEEKSLKTTLTAR